MLGKLTKYEFKATCRFFLPLYGALLLLAAMARLSQWIITYNEIGLLQYFSNIFTLVYVLVVVAIFALTLIVMIQRFYKNLLGDEGYLMFTLPVKSWQLITSKLLTSLVWMVGSVLVLFASFFILIDVEMPTFREFWQSFIQANQAMLREIHTPLWLLMLEVLAVMAAGSAASVLMIYVSIALGHTFTQRHRLLASVAAYVIVSIVLQTAGTLLFTFLLNVPFMNWLLSLTAGSVLQLGLGVTFAISAVTGAVFFAITQLLLQRYLNLE